MTSKHYDVIVIGSGAAGIALALSLADQYRIALISKGELIDGSSPRAQGGIAAVMNQDDSFESHIDDTINAGAGLCHADAVDFTVRHGKVAIQWLIDQGVQFSTEQHSEQIHLTQEGGHSHRRVLHVADKTGEAVVQSISEQAAMHPNIDCLIQQTAIDLIIENQCCLGTWVFNNSTGQTHALFAKKTVLATGGASRCYLYTSNGNQTSGDGIAMAYRAGAAISNLEFNQFHPTTLAHPNAECYLISEAVRGEGGILKLPNGERFMHLYDTREELAPRDIVARAIDSELKKHQVDHVLLDISHLPANDIKRLFPTIYARCLQFDIDMTKQAIPVVPAAHYTCGGVSTDLAGKTNIRQLYAIGEVACTGLHGANRMASNSLLECLVFAMSAAKDIQQTIAHDSVTTTDHITLAGSHQTENVLDLTTLTELIRTTLWNYVGIVRSDARLAHAREEIAHIKQLIEAQYYETKLTKALIECRNLATVALLIIDCALQRKESRGLHFNADYPNTLAEASDSSVQT